MYLSLQTTAAAEAAPPGHQAQVFDIVKIEVRQAGMPRGPGISSPTGDGLRT